jgi:hypothetical protein
MSASLLEHGDLSSSSCHCNASLLVKYYTACKAIGNNFASQGHVRVLSWYLLRFYRRDCPIGTARTVEQGMTPSSIHLLRGSTKGIISTGGAFCDAYEPLPVPVLAIIALGEPDVEAPIRPALGGTLTSFGPFALLGPEYAYPFGQVVMSWLCVLLPRQPSMDIRCAQAKRRHPEATSIRWTMRHARQIGPYASRLG